MPIPPPGRPHFLGADGNRTHAWSFCRRPRFHFATAPNTWQDYNSPFLLSTAIRFSTRSRLNSSASILNAILGTGRIRAENRNIRVGVVPVNRGMHAGYSYDRSSGKLNIAVKNFCQFLTQEILYFFSPQL